MEQVNVPEGGLRFAFISRRLRPSQQWMNEYSGRGRGRRLRAFPTLSVGAEDSKSRNIGKS